MKTHQRHRAENKKAHEDEELPKHERSLSDFFEHGGDLEKAAQLGKCSPNEIIDFSNLLNPSRWPSGLENALKTQFHSLFRHPSEGVLLKEKIAHKIGVSPHQILMGAGTTEFIHFLPLFCKPKKPVIIGPTYGDYAPALRRLGLEPDMLLAREENDWVLSPQQWKNCLKEKPDWIIFSRPNNPLGQNLEGSLLRKIIRDHPEIFFVIDETCIEIADDPSDHFLRNPWPANLAVIRSFSKTYAVPGLRLGYLVVHPDMGIKWKKFQMPWTVSPLAQAAGLYLSDQEEWLSQSQKKNQQEKKRILTRLKTLKNFKVFPSVTTAFTLKGLAPLFSSTEFLKDLLQKEKILIRSLAQHPGLGEAYFRVGLRSPTENDKFLRALQKRDS